MVYCEIRILVVILTKLPETIKIESKIRNPKLI